MSATASRRRLLALAAIAAAALAAYLVLWPVPFAPVAWNAPPAPRDPRFAPNDRFRGLERLGAGTLRGGEAIAIDPETGDVFTGTRDGLVLELHVRTGVIAEVARTGGRPLGLAFDRSGNLYVCDAEKGLLRISAPGGPHPEVTTLATGHGGVPFRFTDDVDVGPDGTVYFTDASSRFGIHETREAILEHGGDGRFLAYHPDTGETELLLSGLQFANGVAVSGDGSYVLVNETGAYRIVRYWLSGPKRGKAEPFAENLPGLPDNVTWSPSRRAFWAALFSPRVPALDALARHPFLRKVVWRVPRALQPEPLPQGFAVAIGEDGSIQEVLRDASKGAFAPVTSVRERDGVLWFGSLEADGIGRLAAPRPAPVAAERR